VPSATISPSSSAIPSPVISVGPSRRP
jgi:hypothetical protein